MKLVVQKQPLQKGLMDCIFKSTWMVSDVAELFVEPAPTLWVPDTLRETKIIHKYLKTTLATHKTQIIKQHVMQLVALRCGRVVVYSPL